MTVPSDGSASSLRALFDRLDRASIELEGLTRDAFSRGGGGPEPEDLASPRSPAP
jgi:hypothetical protein